MTGDDLTMDELVARTVLVITCLTERHWFAIRCNNENVRQSHPVITRQLMSIQTPSRATLQTVLDAVRADPNLTSRQRQDMLSAVRTVARLLGSPPQAIALDVQSLRRRMEGLAPLRHTAFQRAAGTMCGPCLTRRSSWSGR